MRWWIIGILSLMLAACGTVAQNTPMAAPTVTLIPTAVPPTKESTQESASSTDNLVGDPVEGEQLFKTFQPAAGIACSTCHRVDSDDRLVGPGLLHVADRAKTRVAGEDQVTYIHTSIVDPKAYIVDGYMDIMPKNWGQVFTEEQVNDLIAYLLSL